MYIVYAEHSEEEMTKEVYESRIGRAWNEEHTQFTGKRVKKIAKTLYRLCGKPVDCKKSQVNRNE